MKLILPRILLVPVMMVACITTGLRAQTRRAFDPNVPGNCEKELRAAPDSDWVGDLRGWTLRCAESDIRREQSEFALLEKAMASKSKAEREKYDALIASYKSYRAMQLSLDRIGCGGGNGCGAENAADEAHIDYEFLFMAEGFQGAGIPHYSAGDAAAADAKLNAAYQRALSSYPPHCLDDSSGSDEDCVSQTSFRATERAWIRYRDAWVAYGAVAWPQVSADCWRTYLTLQRTKQL